MAKLTPFNEKEIFSNKIEDYLKKTTEDYSRFFDGRSTFVTYYSKNDIASFHESTLDSSIEMIGSNSPIKYNKIENFVLYQFPNLDLNLVDSEMGLTTEIDGECVIPPDMKVEPLVDDYFYLEGLPEQFLFRVTKVNYDKISGKQFYKIEFSLEFYESESINKQVIDTYIGNFTEMEGIIVKKDFDLLEEIDKWYNTIIDFAIENFYYEPMNFFYFPQAALKFYDPIWSMFVIKFDLFKRPKTKEILNSIFLSNIKLGGMLNRQYLQTLYDNSFFKFCENFSGNINNIKAINYIYTGNPSKVNELQYEGDANGILLEIDDASENFIFDEDFLTKLSSKTVFEDNDACGFENFIINYYNGKINKETLTANLELLNFEVSVKTFESIPIILKILKDIRNKILT